MTNLDPIETHSRAITAFFESEAAAKSAVAQLEREGIPSRHITMVAGNRDTGVAAETAGTDTGFMASLKRMFLPDEDQHTYAEGLRRGGYLLSVNTDEANYNKVLDILDVDGSVDMEERETAWKQEGWKGYDAPAASLAAGTVAAPDTATVRRTTVTAEAPSRPIAAAPAMSNASQDDTVSLYEERLKVGKRDVSHGRVRLRSYVVETPVSEQVSLHSETVHVDRRTVDRPVSATDAMFLDRVIEVDDHAEEAVVAKDVRLKEEISLRKDVEDRVQTVTDTVRRTEVEIDDGRNRGNGGARKFVAASDAAMIVERMDVIASDGTKIGIVDHMEGPDRIKLTKQGSSDGQHHYVPLSWIDHVDTHVHLNKTSTAAKAGW